MLTPIDVARARFRSQRLESPIATAPSDLVRWMGAMQAQDLPLSRWSIGQRAVCDETAVIAALADASIVRTHVLRPTWHIVAREDVGWMLALTGERVRARLRPYDRRYGVDEQLIRTTTRAIEAAIRRSGHLTRARLADTLRRRGITVDSGWIVGHLLMHAELRGIICSGAAQGTQQTYALVEERVPHAATVAGDEALAELATRYFQSRSPATLQDFRWWSGLASAEATRAVQAIGGALDECAVAGIGPVLVHQGAGGVNKSRPRRAHLLQAFDELVVAYTATRSVIDQRSLLVNNKPEGLLTRSVVLDGQVCGRWRKEARPDAVTIRVELAAEVSRHDRLAIARAVDEYGAFLGQAIATAFAAEDAQHPKRALRTTTAGK